MDGFKPKLTFQNLIFDLFLIIGSSSLLISNTIMRTYPESGFIIYLLILPLILIGALLAKSHKHIIKIILSNNFLRFLLTLYLLISSFIFLIAYLKVTNDFYYRLTSPLIITIILIITSLIFSSYGINNIINIGFVSFIILILLSSITLLNKTDYDTNLLNTTNFQIDNTYYLIGYLFIFFDVIIVSIFSHRKTNLKKSYIFVGIIACFINTFLIFENYLLFNFQYFIEGRYPYIVKYLAFTKNRYFEHFDLFYLIFVSVYLLFRLSINFEILRINSKFRRNNCLIILFPIYLILTVYLSSNISFGINLINIILTITTIILFIFLIFKNIFLRSSNGK